MPTVMANRRVWESYPWKDGGEEWSAAWGGSDNLWSATLLPRIGRFLDVPAVLEIGAGHGRFGTYLKDRCDRLVLVDLAPGCIDACRRRFAAEPHVEYLVNDGSGLDAVADASIDFVFSFDSLVHADLVTIVAYLVEVDRVLAPGGTAFLHHSNLGSHRDPATGRSTVRNRHFRSVKVSADAVAAAAARIDGFACVGQELISWDDSSELIDCLSCLAHVDAAAPPTLRRRENRGFYAQATELRRVSEHYAAGPAQV